MNIFYKRPLSLILCIWLGGFSLFAFLPEGLRPILLLAPLPLLAALAVKRLRRALTIAAAATLILSLLCSFLYFGLWFRADERFEGEVEVEAVVTELTYSTYPGASVTLKARSVDGAPFSRYKLRGFLSEEDAATVRQGSVVRFFCRLTGFEGDDSFDAESYYASRGYSAKVEDVRDLSVVGEAFLIDFAGVRETVSRRSIMLSGYDAGALFTALLTGERGYLSGNLTLNFTRTGINHVLALSGAHLVILSVIVNRILSLFKIGKKPRVALTALLAMLYVAMTGFSASVTRAGIMLAVAYGLYLLSSAQDSVTALCVSVFVICAVEPYAIYDIGLWLSAFATLGVILAGNVMRRRSTEDGGGGIAAKIRFALLSSLAATLLATGATLLISVRTFSSISLMTFITTPLFSFLSEIYIYLGLVVLAVGDILPIGILMRPFYSLIDGLAEFFSKNRLACFSSEFPLVETTALIFTLLLACFIVFNIKRKKLALGVIALSLSAVFAVAGSLTAAAVKEESIVYTAADSSESFIIRSGGVSAAVDISSGASLSHYDMLDAVNNAGLVELDSAIFTRYSSNLPEKVDGVLSSVYTRRVYIPRPENDDECYLAETVEKVAEEFSAEVRYYSELGSITVGSLRLSQKFRVPYGEGTATTLLEIEGPDGRIAYLGSGTLADSAASEQVKEALSTADTLILGSCGKKYKKSYRFDDRYQGIERIILSGEGLFFTQEARIFYDERGTEFCLRPRRLELLPMP